MNKNQVFQRAAMAAAAVTITLAAPATFAAKPGATKCTPQNFMFTARNYDAFVPAAGSPYEAYPLCVRMPSVFGTIQGTYLSCIVNDPAGDLVPNWSLFHLGTNADDWVGYWDEWFETADGNLKVYSIGVSYGTAQLQSGLTRVMPGSTGKFAGMSGMFSFTPDWQTYDPTSGAPFAGTMRFSGYLCKP